MDLTLPFWSIKVFEFEFEFPCLDGKKEKKRRYGHIPDFDTERSNHTRLVLPRKRTLCSLRYFTSELGDLVKIPTH